MSIIDSNRFMKDVGAVEVDAKQHEVMPGIKEAQAKGGAKSGLNSSATVDPNVKAVVGADGKGIVNVTVVAPKEQDSKNKPAATKPAMQPVTPAVGTIGSGTVGSVSVAPTAAVGAPARTPLLGRGRGRGLATRLNTPPTVKPNPTNLAPTTANTTQALTAKADAPRPDTKTKAKPKADGQVEVKQVAVSVNLQETRREKIMHLIQGGNLPPDVNEQKNKLQPHAGMKPDYRNQMGVGGRSPATAAKKLDNGSPQIEMKQAAPAADAPKPATTQKLIPSTAKLAQTPKSAPSPFGS